MYAPGVKVGATAQIGLPENPEKVYAAKVVRIAGGLDAMTRTLQVEINLPNDQAHLLPGAYATVTLSLLNTHEKRLTLPTNSLLFRPDGVYVVLVQNEHAHLALVQLGSDLGARVEIVAGVEPEDQVVINPPDSILDGQSLLAQAWKTPATAVTPASAAHSPAQSPAKGG
jgi:multidrug efflux pump subunit AcrA (membrane-fusion protein)